MVSFHTDTFDDRSWETKQVCGGYPKSLEAGPLWGSWDTTSATRFNIIKVNSNTLIYKTDRMIWCIDVLTDSLCAGNWPYNTSARRIVDTTWPMSLHMSVRYGPVDGVCLYWGCLDLQANNRSDWLPTTITDYYYRRLTNPTTSYTNHHAQFPTTPLGHTWYYTPCKINRAA